MAIHCKAGKGRTGLAIACYILFMEGCRESYDAIELFNRRRTLDMKGLSIPSQIRYAHYFDHFLSSTFRRPYKQLIAPHIRDPDAFEAVFRPKQHLKLTSICLGPFSVNPDHGKGMKIEIKLDGFDESDLFRRAFLDKTANPQLGSSGSKSRKERKLNPTHYSQRAVYDSMMGQYYFLILFNSLILIEEDVCIQLKTIQTPSAIEPMKFKYWLSARFVKE